MKIYSKEYVLNLGRAPGFWAGALIAIAWLAVLLTGLMAPQAMIGDEVTHYYMLVEQAGDLSVPNFYAKIPTGWGDIETRCYPHVIGWHYIGALVCRLSGGSFAAVQFYHSLFWLQFLIIGYFLARRLSGGSTWVGLVYVATMMSLPMAVLFSVGFYQDVPMTAQVVTAFYLLIRRKWVWATLLMALALTLKLNAVMFVPPFVLLLGWFMLRKSADHQEPERGWKCISSKIAVFISACILLGGTMWGMDAALQKHAGSNYYLVPKIRQLWHQLTTAKDRAVADKIEVVAGEDNTAKPAEPQEGSLSNFPKFEIIANHPGDLRFARNWALYFGGVIWAVAGMGLFAGFLRYRKLQFKPYGLMFLVGLAYIIPTAFFLRTAPDARFFLPGLPFLLLPFCAWAVSWRYGKLFAICAVIAALSQGGAVLAKAYELRNVSGGIKEAIAFVRENKPVPARVFMYPEGNYRLFPVQHEWYLNYGLREFWRGSNDFRLEMLARHNIGGIVVKKHLIQEIDQEMHNLGVYPPEFVRDLEGDERFRKVFENEAVIVYYVEKTADQ